MTTTWNPADKDATITLSNGNLTATATGDGIVRATTSFLTGAWYFEFVIDAGGNYTEVGVATSSATYYIGYENSGWAYGNDGKKYYDYISFGSIAYGNSFTTGDIIGVAVNADWGQIWFSKNGVWQNSGDPENGTGDAFDTLTGTLFPAISLSNGKSITAVFLSSALTYTPPVGYSAIDVGGTVTTFSNNEFEYTLDFDAAFKYAHSNNGPDFIFDFEISPSSPRLESYEPYTSPSKSSNITWSPFDKSITMLISDDLLTVTYNGLEYDRAADFACATISKTSGKWFWRHVVNTDTCYIGTRSGMIDQYTNTQYVGLQSDQWSYSNGGWKVTGGSAIAYGDSFTISDVIDIALDLDLGKIWFAKNGVWQNSGDPANGTGEAFSGITGPVYPMVSILNTGSITGQFSFSSETIPNGFSALTKTMYPDIRPKAYVMFRNYEISGLSESETWYLLGTATQFSISNAANNPSGSFSVTINKADLYNWRIYKGDLTNNGVIDPHIKKVIRIYYSADNGQTYSLLFEGFPESTPENYSYGDVSAITISGKSKSASNLTTSYFEPLETWSGTAKQLLAFYGGKGGSTESGGYIITTGDGRVYVDQDFGYTNALSAVQDSLKLWDSNYFHYIDYSSGVATYMIGRNLNNGIFEYDDSNIISLSLDWKTGIVTRCEVIGFDEDAIFTATGTPDNIRRHGDNTLNISSGLIKTSADATYIAIRHCHDANEMQKTFSINCLLNPYVQVARYITINSDKSGFNTSSAIITAYSHNYQHGNAPTTTISGYYSKLNS